jgi:hypothetical protein
MSPWMSMTFCEPAFRWNPSTFCVSTHARSRSASMRASASCPVFGFAPRQARSIWWMYFQVSSGRSRKTAPLKASSMRIPSSVTLSP